MNALPTLGAVLALGGFVAVVSGVTYYFTPAFWEVGYEPEQPGTGFNHRIHAGKLGMDCRYCHSNVEDSKIANVPTVSVCYGCHQPGHVSVEIVADEKVQFVREAYAGDAPIPWINIHVLPDYVQFPHHVHVKAGVSCYSCHGQIMGMPVVYQAESLSMKWCLDCHRDPERQLVPPGKVTDLEWVQQEWLATKPADRAHEGVTPEALVSELMRDPPEHCAACHY